MVNQLSQSNFGLVYKVKDSIVNRQKEAIPELIEMLKDTSFVKLKNTSDLIYPGAEQYYGHGWIVNYDIDWISVRAAWLLEEITFHNFEYRDLTINEDRLMNLHKQNYTSYLKTGSHNVDFKNQTPKQQLIIYRLMLADKAAQWWKKNKKTWARYTALKEALSSEDELSQNLALQYLRFGETFCEGLNLENYKTEIKPLVQKIVASKNNNSEQAEYLLEDDINYIFKQKQNKSSR
ncbi:hypothetical protein ABF226_002279 [Flavobacterium psychrophilum]